MRYVHVWQACLLSLNIDPNELERKLRAGWRDYYGRNDEYPPVFEPDWFASREEYDEYHDRLKLLINNLATREFFSLPIVAKENLNLQPVLLPAFAAWLLHIGFTLPDELAKTAATRTPTEAPVNPASLPADGEGKGWVAEARRIALAYIKRHKDKDLHPSQNDVCEHVSVTMRKEQIYGPTGKPLGPSYIQRNAIQGEWWKEHAQDGKRGKRGKVSSR